MAFDIGRIERASRFTRLIPKRLRVADTSRPALSGLPPRPRTLPELFGLQPHFLELPISSTWDPRVAVPPERSDEVFLRCSKSEIRPAQIGSSRTRRCLSNRYRLLSSRVAPPKRVSRTADSPDVIESYLQRLQAVKFPLPTSGPHARAAGIATSAHMRNSVEV